MEETSKRSGESDKLAALTANGHLLTPALSPIDETGEQAVQPLTLSNGGIHTTNEWAIGERHNQQDHDAATDIIKANGESHPRRESFAGGPSTPRLPNGDSAKVYKLSPQKIEDLVTSADSLPIRAATPIEDIPELSNGLGIAITSVQGSHAGTGAAKDTLTTSLDGSGKKRMPSVNGSAEAMPKSGPRPSKTSRSASSPMLPRKQSASKVVKAKPDLTPLSTVIAEEASRQPVKPSPKRTQPYSPVDSLPIPPLSLPTYLQLELSSARPSALYIHRSVDSDAPYESSTAKFERLMNFLLLPPYLEQVLWFGAIACLDAWLYTFTMLPLRFLKAVAILVQWWGQTAVKELQFLWSFVYSGVGRVWRRNRAASVPSSRRPSIADGEHCRRPSMIDGATPAVPSANGHVPSPELGRKSRRSGFRHRRTRSVPSLLLPDHKADILQGLLILAACFILLWFDASRMYHSIRGQSAIKLYVIYNVLEVFDKLFSALGQDILECLFSKETLERNEHGRSKIMRPFWLWVLALIYVVIHSAALFYQVVTLNVAVNSYSNALLTLLMSNQFVEIKGTVFKKIEKENLFQLTCADVVERFQLWLMLLIIALRNIVEVGGLSISISSALGGSSTPTESFGANVTGAPLTFGFVIPQAFTLLPKWTGEVLGPFLIVLGSEALVDWCKHAYIGKFNQVKPNVYGRFLDVLAKDYYSHAFADQNLMKRLGLPVIPLSCLFIRACMQTYHMFLATHVPLPIPSPATAVSVGTDTATTSPATTAALQHIDQVFRRALGRSSFGAGGDSGRSFSWWSIDDLIAFGTMLTFFLAVYLILLAFKLLLGMLLLSYSRSRYSGMKEREQQSSNVAEGKRAGIGAMTEVGEDKRRWIYEDDSEGLKALREKEERGRKQSREKGDKLKGVHRYMMAAKRIW